MLINDQYIMRIQVRIPEALAKPVSEILTLDYSFSGIIQLHLQCIIWVIVLKLAKPSFVQGSTD